MDRRADAPEPSPTSPRCALVTGGAIRVGAAIVRALAAAGYRVWIHYNSSEAPAARLASELGAAALGTLGADLSDEEARRRIIDAVLDPEGPAAGRLDLLVNSAASFESGAFLARSDADLLRVLTINLLAPLSLIRGLAPALGRSEGAVVNILDLAATQPWRGYADHCVSKAALAMATKALAAELAPRIRVNGVSPGTVLWPENEAFAPGSEGRERVLQGIPLGRAGDPEDVARAVLYLARERFITGHSLVVDGGRAVGRGACP
ncbi:MAG: SDR family oxidoreductase [Nannocystaceae bacterium]